MVTGEDGTSSCLMPIEKSTEYGANESNASLLANQISPSSRPLRRVGLGLSELALRGFQDWAWAHWACGSQSIMLTHHLQVPLISNFSRLSQRGINQIRFLWGGPFLLRLPHFARLVPSVQSPITCPHRLCVAQTPSTSGNNTT